MYNRLIIVQKNYISENIMSVGSADFKEDVKPYLNEVLLFSRNPKNHTKNLITNLLGYAMHSLNKENIQMEPRLKFHLENMIKLLFNLISDDLISNLSDDNEVKEKQNLIFNKLKFFVNQVNEILEEKNIKIEKDNLDDYFFSFPIKEIKQEEGILLELTEKDIGKINKHKLEMGLLFKQNKELDCEYEDNTCYVRNVMLAISEILSSINLSKSSDTIAQVISNEGILLEVAYSINLLINTIIHLINSTSFKTNKLQPYDILTLERNLKGVRLHIEGTENYIKQRISMNLI